MPEGTPKPGTEAKPERYAPQSIEEKWAARWAADANLYAAEPSNSAHKKYYVLEMLRSLVEEDSPRRRGGAERKRAAKG